MKIRKIIEFLNSFTQEASTRIPFTRLNVIYREICRVSDEGTILDLGCGNGNNMKLIISKLKGNFKVTGMDVSISNLEQAEACGIYEQLVLGNLNEELPFEGKTYDVVVLFEVLEHLPKNEGSGLLQKMESVARKAVIVSTPAYLDRKRRGTVDEDIAYYLELYKDTPTMMPHISVWTAEEFKTRGYIPKRANGIHVPWLPSYLNLAIAALSAPFSYAFLPYIPASLVAVKRVASK